MRKSNREVNGEKVFRYSIRKYHFGAASVAVAALMFFANGAVKADTLVVSPVTANTEKVNAGVTGLTEGVPPKENLIEKSKEVEGDKTTVAQKLVDKSPLVQAISDLQAAIAKVDEESLLSLSNQLTQLTDENNRLLNGENISEEAIASQVSRVQFLTEQVRQLKSKTEDKASNKEDRSGSKVQDKREFEVSENAVTLVNQTEEIKKSVKDVKVEEVFTNKTKLETLLKEIDKLDPEKYTEDSVKGLKEKVAKAKEVLTIAKNQEEVNSVYKELVNYKNSSLRRVKMTHKPLEENTPKLDTTNGKETVGKKAQNTEPNDRNIAGHNHILNGITLPEGSGLRAAPNNANFRYETDGADLSSLVAGEELGYGKKIIIKVKYDTKVISTRDVYITTTPNTGPRTEYTRRQQDGIGPYDGGTNIKLVGSIPNDMIGTYDLHVHVLNNKRNNAQMATLNVPITVKPKKPTVSVADLVNAEGKKPVVTATVANTSISKVEFYLNGQKQTEVNATNGQATWTPTNALRENDRITVKNIAKGGIPPRDAYGNTFTTRETASDMSDPVVIPKAPKPAFDLGAEKSNAKAELGRIAQAEITAINGDKSLTTTEKTAKVQEVNTKKTQGEQAIDAASVNDADKVAQAKETAKTAIEGVHTPGNLATVKSNAKAALEEAAKAEKSEIASDNSVTSADRVTQTNAVDTKKTEAEGQNFSSRCRCSSSSENRR
ncbi:YSIRK-type signal peptide-containing protein [Streptococcus mitis]|uniref:YSIRK-type signal peptide-containing protein n=1 Tax=Streptococcus mitis TaxID=28037 RepID=A0A6I1TXB8_STRMT|nr:YSIRK-type signal peptide-containing protein [Streptococcus mitis]MQQ29804.1 YSIRK-type signal peptide-containing protein [Streptococcus mitis]